MTLQNLLITSDLLVLIHDVIPIPDATSCDKYSEEFNKDKILPW